MRLEVLELEGRSAAQQRIQQAAKVGTTSGEYETQAPRYKARGRVNGKNERKAGGREKRGRLREFQDINIT